MLCIGCNDETTDVVTKDVCYSELRWVGGDANGQLFELTTNRAGNFFVEGNPNEFAKPFRVELEMGNIRPLMPTRPMYGGCARCHDPSVPRAADVGLSYDPAPTDAEYRNGTARIGIGGFSPGGTDTPTVEEELRALAGAER